MFPMDFERISAFKSGIDELCKTLDIRLVAFEVTEYNGEGVDAADTARLPSIKAVFNQRQIISKKDK